MPRSVGRPIIFILENNFAVDVFLFCSYHSAPVVLKKLDFVLFFSVMSFYIFKNIFLLGILRDKLFLYYL